MTKEDCSKFMFQITRINRLHLLWTVTVTEWSKAVHCLRLQGEVGQGPNWTLEAKKKKKKTPMTSECKGILFFHLKIITTCRFHVRASQINMYILL
jgi:hypothetical protein